MEQQNNEKLSDKAFARLVVTSVLGILICLICLCSTTYAWFLDSVPNNGNEIKTADVCLLSVSVRRGDVELEDIENGVELYADVVYTVTLELPMGSASGYCVITAGGKPYYTDYISRHESEQAKTLSFELKVAKTQSVVFESRWGIYSGEPHVGDSEQLFIE